MFHERNGHCRVPITYKANKKLAIWVSVQRSAFSEGKLSQNRIIKLESIGFEWDPYSVDWERNFNFLQTFHKENGHCRVPQFYKDDKELGYWASNQRSFYSKGKLSSDRIARLEALGFEWDPINAEWERNFIELKTFNTLHGHCRVPQAYPKLGRWTSRQRVSYSQGKLSPQRIARLEALGFEWKLR